MRAWEGWVETLEILAEPELVEAIREGLEDLAANRLVTHEEVWGDFGEAASGSPTEPRRP